MRETQNSRFPFFVEAESDFCIDPDPEIVTENPVSGGLLSTPSARA